MGKLLFKLLFPCIFLFGCITNRDTNLLQNRADKHIWQTSTYEYYRLQPNDYITYSVFSSDQETAKLFSASVDQSSLSTPDQSVSYRIFPDGFVDLPFIGKLNIANKTLAEAGVILRARVREFLPDAEVRIVLSTDYFYIIGGGRFPVFKNRMTIYQALAGYSGKNIALDKKHVRLVRRKNDGTYEVRTIDLRQAALIETDDYFIKPNDIIYFPTSGKSFFQLTSVPDFLGFVLMPVSVFLLILNL